MFQKKKNSYIFNENFKIIGSPIPITPSQSIFVTKNVSPQNHNNVNKNTKIADHSKATFDCRLCDEKFYERNQLKLHNLFSCGEFKILKKI